MPKSVKILALPNAYGASLMGMVDMLEAANTIAAHQWELDEKVFDIELVTIDGQDVRCSNGLTISGASKLVLPAPASMGKPYQPELLILATPFMPQVKDLNGFENIWRKEITWLQQYHHHYAQIGTHCNGTFILAEAGLLNEQQVTTSWWLARQFKKRYPGIKLSMEKRVINSGRFLLGGSSSCYRELIMSFVQQHAGVDIARVLSRYFLISNNQTSQMLHATSLPLDSENPIISRAQKWIMDNLDKDLSVTDVASKAAVTTRTLVRHFQKDLGHSPQTHIQKLRIEKSKALLESTRLKFNEIAKRCGYSDEGAFRRIFKKHCEVSPTEFRRMFQMVAQEA